MKIVLIFLILFKSLTVQSQYSLFPASDPRSLMGDSKYVSSHSILSCQSESYTDSKLDGGGITYFDSLGWVNCYDSFDSLGNIRYTGFYDYESNPVKLKKFTGIHHSSGKRYVENFYRIFEGDLLMTDSSDRSFGATYFFYDSRGREIKQVGVFKDSNWVRTILKGYSDLSNNLIWYKDYFRKNGKEYLDSHIQFYYDEKSNLIKEEELITNNNNTSNTNRGNIQYFYNEQGFKSRILEPYILNKFEYDTNGLLSEYLCFFKESDIFNESKIVINSKYRYTFY